MCVSVFTTFLGMSFILLQTIAISSARYSLDFYKHDFFVKGFIQKL